MISSAEKSTARPRKVERSSAVTGTRSIALTEQALQTLTAYQADAAGALGRKISASAVVRAALALCDAHGLDVTEAIAAELNAGTVVWGGR